MARITEQRLSLHLPRLTTTLLLRVLALACTIAYLLGVSWYLLTHGGWPTPDYLIPPLLLMAIALGRGWPFVLDWGPFLVLILSWQATAGIADELGQPVHVEEPAEFDFRLFGGRLPTVELQERFFDPSVAQWYDWLATFQHAMHFVLPIVVGIAIWLSSRRTYWRYLLSIMVLFYIGFAIYALYPAAPPWLASLQGSTPPVERVAIATVHHLPSEAPIGLAYTHFSANEVAAVPSLHAALPMLIALVLVRLVGIRALPAVLYPLLMGFNLVYLGEHYAFDVLAGFAVALAAFTIVWILPDLLPVRVPAWRLRPKLTVPTMVRRTAGLALPALAAVSVLVIGFSLRPDRPTDVAGPVIPGLQVQAGRSDLAGVVPCGEGSTSGLMTDPRLAMIAERYIVYVFDLTDESCYVLTASDTFSPPRTVRTAALAERAPTPLTELQRRNGPMAYYTLQAGVPSQALIDAGLNAERRYLAVAWVTGVSDIATAATTLNEIIGRAIVTEAGP
jgi:membrane-associated phospholipid phosphatase